MLLNREKLDVTTVIFQGRRKIKNIGYYNGELINGPRILVDGGNVIFIDYSINEKSHSKSVNIKANSSFYVFKDYLNGCGYSKSRMDRYFLNRDSSKYG